MREGETYNFLVASWMREVSDVWKPLQFGVEKEGSFPFIYLSLCFSLFPCAHVLCYGLGVGWWGEL